MTVRFGLLSTAAINHEILAAARESKIADVVAVASRDAARAEAYASRHDIPRAYGDYRALLDDPGVDAVYVSLPNALHAEWSIRALEAGKHVLCEKPFSRHPHEVERAFHAAEGAGRLLSEGLVSRHHPQTDLVVELVEGGAVGELRALSAAFSFTLTDPNDTRLRPELGGGALMDIGCYCVSSLRALAGEPERVYAEQIIGPSGVDLRAVAALRFRGGVLARLEVGMDLPFRHEVEVVGSEGSLFLADPWHAVAPAIELRRDGEVERIQTGPANAFLRELENLCAAIAGGAAPLLGRADALGQACTLDALLRSAAEGRPVSPTASTTEGREPNG
jgi:D-xylose 1-dehydrogenase (NADP+, D-xylono-1,5-lactone-forming)